jgi:hypothetical protein
MSGPAAVAAVEFPVVVVGEALLTSVRVERLPALDRQERFALGHQRDDVLDILIDARSGEEAVRRLDGILVRFLRRDFSGASFGAALALADKRARYPSRDEAAAADRLIATGQLICGSRGAIARVEGFDAKVRRVLASVDGAGAPPVFIFPAANWQSASEEVRAALETAQGQGRIRLRPAERIDELADLWGGAEAPDSQESARLRRRRGLVLASAAAAAGLGAAVALALSYDRGAPLRDCERALGMLEDAAQRRRADRVAAAVHACAAAARRPGSARALFLAGQAHALNGGERLAASHWRRSAEAGDTDGLAAWGRLLWLSAPDDPRSVQQALVALNKAAERDSPAALEDMAEIYREGRAVPPDLARAEALLSRAQEIRADLK